MSRSPSSRAKRTIGVPPTRSARFDGIAICGLATGRCLRGGPEEREAPTTIAAVVGASFASALLAERYFLQGVEVFVLAVVPSANCTLLSATHLPVHLVGAPISGI